MCLQIVYTGCLNVHGIQVTVNNSTTNNNVSFCDSDLKIVFYNNS